MKPSALAKQLKDAAAALEAAEFSREMLEKFGGTVRQKADNEQRVADATRALNGAIKAWRHPPGN